MANIKTALGGASAITITLASLGNLAGRESTLVDNTSNLFLDAELSISITMGAAAPTGNAHALLSSTVDGTLISSPATGADAALTPAQIDMLGAMKPGDVLPGTGLIYLGKLNTLGLAAAAVLTENFPSLAAILPGGNIPPKWGVVIVNCTGQALDATAGNHKVQYDGVYATSV
jgi:hypothetical protein